MMSRVSRSFALVVNSLEEPLNYHMATAYLICRVVDNIEDCTQPFSWQQQRFDEFEQLLETPENARLILTGWDQEHWPGLTEDEVSMMGLEQGLPLWKIYAQIPVRYRTSIHHWSSAMAEGMRLIENPEQAPQLIRHKGVQMLADEEDYNRYCFFVAGTVGHMATELVIQHYQLNDDIAETLLDTSEACGRGLQKTNILKDFAEDLQRGVSYLPASWHQEIEYEALALAGAPIEWKHNVIDDIVGELRVATMYVLALPYTAAGYRMAALMSLLPAYQTLLLAAKKQDTLFTPKHRVKISRPTMAKCQLNAKSLLKDNEAVRLYSRRLQAEIDSAFAKR